MPSTDPTAPAPSWARPPARAPQPSPAPPRRPGRYAVLGVMLALLGVAAGLLSWVRPLRPPYVVPLWVTDYLSPALPPVSWAEADRDAIRLGGYFAREPDAYTVQESALLRKELRLLDTAKPGERVVVYLSAYALELPGPGRANDAPRDVLLLAADADPREENFRAGGALLSLREVLDGLARSPAEHQLLVLDLTQPVPDARAGGLYADAAARVPELVRAAREASPGGANLLVLCSCSPGQRAHSSEVLGRTVFGYYFEQALRGGALAYGGGKGRSRRVSAREVARYVRAHVDRWVRQNKGDRQTPVLYGDGPDFDLTAVRRGFDFALPLRNAEAYPGWLEAGWRVLEGWRADGSLGTAPRVYLRLQEGLLRAEAAWRGGARGREFVSNARGALDRIRAEMAAARDPGPPSREPASLALAESFGARPDPDVAAALDKLLAAVRAIPPGKPGDAEKATDALVKAFAAKQASAPPFAVEHAVLAQAGAPASSPLETLALLDRVLKARAEAGQPPAFIETLFLTRLAALAAGYQGPGAAGTWPTGSTGMSLGELVLTGVNAVRRVEEVCSRPELRAVAAADLERCAQARWEAELLIPRVLDGTVLPEEVVVRLREAVRSAEVLAAFSDAYRRARQVADLSLATLLDDARYLDADPAREPLWQARLSATRELLPSLDLSPPGSVDEGWLTARTEELSRKARDLEAAVAAYAPFSLAPGAGPADPANWVLRSVLRPDAGPAALARIDALLEFPSMPVDQRLRLLAARAAAARRSGEATRDQDLADSGAPLPEPVFSEADQAAFRDAEVRRAAVRARCHVALLRLAGLPETTLGDLEQALRRAVRDGRDSPAWPELAEGIRLAWARDLGEVLRLEEASPERADLLGFLYPAYTPVPALDSPPGGPRAAREGRLRGELYRWLADRYRYAAASGLDPEFFEDAAQDMERLAPPAPPVRVTITPPAAAPVSDAAPRDVVLPVRVTGPRAIPDRLEFQVLSHSPRLLIRPEAGVVPLEEDPLTGERAGRIELSVGRDARAPATAASPKGFVVAVRVGDRSYFQEVPLEPPAPEAPLELIVDRVAQNPVGLGDQLRLRPSAAGEQLYVFVRNRSAEPREAVVHLRVPGGGPPLTSAKLTLTPGQTHLVPFDPPPPAPAPKTQTPAPKARTPAPAGTELFLPAELRLEVVDAKPPGEVIASRALRLDVADPIEYVEVAAARFEPPAPPGRPLNRLWVTLRPRRDLGDAPCVATLVLDPESIPGFQGVLAGKLSGNLPAGGGELRLDAQGLRLDPEAPEEGVVTVTVDGVEHAFRLLTLFARQGEPTSPILDRSPRLRLRLLPPPNPGRSIAFTAAADRAPAGSRLEVRLLRTPDGPSAAPDRAQTFALPRQESAEMTVQPGGALLVKATVRDWQVTWDLPSLVGRRELQLRLLAADGSELLTESLPVVLDVTGPEAVRFLDLPERAKKGEPLRVRVTGRDPASGVRAVSIFLGKPVNDRPPPNVTPVAAQPSKGDPGVWEAEVPLPADRTGPTDLTAQFVNGAGLSSFASGSVELVNELPPATGSVEGTLLEGSIPQGGLEVQLLTDAGKPIRTTKTDANGRFRFDGITPGKYRLAATKQAAVTRNASAPVEVQAGKTTPVELSLYL